jgi:hypothetical protein
MAKIFKVIIPWLSTDLPDPAYCNQPVTISIGKFTYIGTVVALKMTAEETSVSVMVPADASTG